MDWQVLNVNEVLIEVKRDDGKSFFIDNMLWKITSDGLEGFDYLSPSVSTEANVFDDGSRYVGSRVEQIDRTIKCRFNDSLENKALQREFIRNFFNHKHKYQVIVDYMGQKKYCEGVLLKLSLPTENIYRPLELQFTILCYQPYMLSYDNFAKNIADVIGGLEFDFEITNDGLDFGEYSFSREVTIDNKGDVDTNLMFVLKAKGNVTNPKVVKGDKFVRLIDKLVVGDEVVFDLISKPVKITKNGQNVIGKTDRFSSFSQMKMNVGENVIKYDADDGYNNLDVFVYYNERYYGI